MSSFPLKNHLLLTTALAGVVFFGYGRRAYAACVNSGGSTYLCSGANATTQTINADNADVYTDGTFSVNTAAGNAITITGDGALSFTDSYASVIESTVANGVYIRSTGDNGVIDGSITVNLNSQITNEQYHGITTINDGSGAINVTTNGSITSVDYFGGIYAINSGTDININLGVTSSVTSNNSSVLLRNYGSGEIYLVANGSIESISFNGMEAINYYGTDLTINTGLNSSITSNNEGILARNYGTGILSVTVNGDITSTADRGVYLRNQATTTNANITTGSTSLITSVDHGIYVRNQGSGETSLTLDGDITTSAGYGVRAINNGTNLELTTGIDSNIDGEYYGILLRNYGSGQTTIEINGIVNGTDNAGVYTYADPSTNGITLTTGADSNISGGEYGINFRNRGNGSVSNITINGDITATGGKGLYALNYNNVGDMIIITGSDSTITGTTYGVTAKNFGIGYSLITLNGDITATTGKGLYARNLGTNLSITTGSSSVINSDEEGIYAKNDGSGEIDINIDGDITTNDGYGVYLINSATATNISITTGTTSLIDSDESGILARNNGTGEINVDLSGDITSSNNYGIFARNFSNSTDISITTGTDSIINSLYSGIYAQNDGTGEITINASGDITSSNGLGIKAFNQYGTNLYITTNADSYINSYEKGIRADNSGSGILNIIVNGDITSTSNEGVISANHGTDLNITIGSNSVIDSSGVFANNYGTGELNIVANGTITSSFRGIGADNNGTDLSITTGVNSLIQSYDTGIYTRNDGVGVSNITANGDITSSNGLGSVDI